VKSCHPTVDELWKVCILCLWQNLNLNLLTFYLNLLLFFSFYFLNFLSISSWVLIETLNKFHLQIFVKKCELESDKLHSALYNLPLAVTSHIKCISVFILCTLYSSYHFAFWNFELNGQRQEGNCTDVTIYNSRIWPIEMQKGWPSMCYRNMNFPISTKFIRQWTACTAVWLDTTSAWKKVNIFADFVLIFKPSLRLGTNLWSTNFIVILSVHIYVCPTVLNIFLPGGRNFMKFDIGILENPPEIFKF
jgi:hypothetical protein